MEFGLRTSTTRFNTSPKKYMVHALGWSYRLDREKVGTIALFIN
jgi:hypothetical protein